MIDRKVLFVPVALFLLATSMLQPAFAQGIGAQRPFDIPAGPLADALDKLGEQAGITISYDAKAINGVTVAAVNGKLTARDALNKLLANTGLRIDSINDKTVVLKRANDSSLNKAPADQMRLAETSSAGEAVASARKDEKDDDSRQVVVKDKKIKPYTDANADIPRTIDDEQPYYIFDSETIERSGAANIEDFLKRRLTMNTTDAMSSQVGTGGGITGEGGNISKFNLRGLGTDKTLILVNGRRRAGAVSIGAENPLQADLNGIPLNAIDRIEVLPTSASGIYGGSAIGGVINVILKKDYSGANLTLSYDNAADTDAPNRAVTGLYGFSLEGGRTDVTLSASWADSEPMLFQDRADLYQRNLAGILQRNPTFIYAADDLYPPLGSTVNIRGLDPNTFGPATLVLRNGLESLGTSTIHLDPGVSPMASPGEFAAALRGNTGYNMELPRTAQSQGGLMRPLGQATEIRSFRLTLDRKMLPWLDAYSEISWSENAARGTVGTSLNIPLYLDKPYAPFTPVSSNPFTSIALLTVPLPPSGSEDHDRNAINKATAKQLGLGLRTHLPAGWIVLLDYQISDYAQSNRWFQMDDAELTYRVLEGSINPFVDTGLYPLDIDDLWYPVRVRNGSRLTTWSLRGSGRLFSLPWGATQLTAGLEQGKTDVRAQTLSVDYPFSSPFHQSRGYVDHDQYVYPRRQSVDALYAELEIPLVATGRYPGLHSLSLQLTGRADHSETDAGTVFKDTIYQNPVTIRYNGRTVNGQPYFTTEEYESKNHTLGLKYQPLSWVTLRASAATAFLPPLPSQLQEDPTIYPEAVLDPVKNISTPNVTVFKGGNPDIQPQNSESLNVGAIIEPQMPGLKGLRLNAEYYSIKQYDAIGFFNLFMESTFPDRVVRNANGFVTQVDFSAVNLYLRETAGFDFSVGYDLETAHGNFNLQATQSTIRHLRTQYTQSDPAYEAVGYHPGEGGAPKHKASATLTWSRNNWTAGWAMSYVSSYKQYGAAGGPVSEQSYGGSPYLRYITPQGSDTISSQAYHDLYMGYTFDSGHSGSLARVLNGMSLNFGLKNVFDKAPPLDVWYPYLFYTSGYGDTRLRSYWLNARMSF